MSDIEPILVDGNNLIVRCVMQTALSDLKAGQTYTGGVYGALHSLLRLLEANPRSGPVVMAFDRGSPPERRERLAAYKQARRERQLLDPEAHKAAMEQVVTARRMFGMLGCRCIDYPDREADDVLYGLARLCSRVNVSPLVVTSDRDLLQCVSYGAAVDRFTELVTPANFRDRIGVDVRHYVLYRALVGDPSDGIPGVPGCGAKRAAQIINERAAGVLVEATGTDDAVERLLRWAGSESARPGAPGFIRSLADSGARLRTAVAVSRLGRFAPSRAELRDALASGTSGVDQRAFLRACKALGFQSVNHARFVSGYGRAAKCYADFQSRLVSMSATIREAGASV